MLLGVLSAFGPLSIDLYLPGLPKLTSDFGTSASAGQLTLTACVLGLAFGQLVAGPLSDRFGRRPPLLAGLALYCVASVACAVASSVWLLVGFRLVQGLSGAAGIVISRSIVRDLRSGVAAARLFSLLMLVLGSVPVIAPVVGGQLLRVISWRGLFVVLAGVDAVILAAVAFTLHETLPPERRRRAGGTVSSFLELLRDRLFLAYAVVLGLAGAEVLSYIAGSSFVLQDLYRVSPQMYGAIFGLNALGIIACSQLNRVLLGRVTPERLLGAGVVAGAS
ncbi:MAG TPA: multidrug effflux MFS transporter, partial [Gaiellaceae bacterium]|nr:multidrug effflux MFS transporter [Gaiellaceae bacterium]